MCRHGEVGAAVLLDRNGAQHVSRQDHRIAGCGRAQSDFVRRSAGGNRHRNDLVDTQRLDLRSFGPFLEAVVHVNQRQSGGFRRFRQRGSAGRREYALRVVGDDRRSLARAEGHGALTRDRRVAVDQFLVAERVDQVYTVSPRCMPSALTAHSGLHARVVHAEVVVLAERPGRRVNLGAALCLGECDVGRQAFYRRHSVVVGHARVEHYQRTERLPVVRGGGGDVLVRSGNRPDVQLHVRAFSARGEIPVNRPRIAPVGRGDPWQVRGAAVTVDVVPARVDDHTVVGDAGMPLVGLVVAEALDLRSVGLHVVQRVSGAGPPAAEVSASPLGDERQAPVGHPARVEIVPRAVGQLLQSGPVNVHLEDVIGSLLVPVPARGVGVAVVPCFALAFNVGERDFLRVVRQVGREERSVEFRALQAPGLDHRIAHDVADLLGVGVAERIRQHVNAPAAQRVDAVVLVAHVIESRAVARDEQYLVEVQKRI